MNQIYITKVINGSDVCKTNRKGGSTVSVRLRGGWKASYTLAVEMAGWAKETPENNGDWLQFQCVQCWWYLPKVIQQNCIKVIGWLGWALIYIYISFFGLMLLCCFENHFGIRLHASCNLNLAIWDNSFPDFPGFWVYPHWGLLTVWLGCQY